MSRHLAPAVVDGVVRVVDVVEGGIGDFVHRIGVDILRRTLALQ